MLRKKGGGRGGIDKSLTERVKPKTSYTLPSPQNSQTHVYLL